MLTGTITSIFADFLFKDLQLYLKKPKNLLNPGYQFY